MSVIKPKPQQLPWPITTGTKHKMNRSELEANTRNRHQTRENAFDQVAIGVGFVFDWSRSGARLFNQSKCEVKRNQSKTRTTLTLK